jgi:uncharacterized protein (TIGR01777 family)
MQLVVTGATGTIGRALVGELRERGHNVVALSRDARRAADILGSGVKIAVWPDPAQTSPPAEALGGSDAVFNLLGEPIAQRWTAEAKRRIRTSRVETTRRLVGAIRELDPDRRPRILISQSATGFYGARGNEWVDEDSDPGTDWLAELTADWEGEAAQASDIMRVVRTRTGVVLSPDGGALARMLPFFRLGIGGPVAGGDQYVPWVHLDDVVGALIACLENADVSGPVNITSPTPATNAELSRALGRALQRPAVLPVPGLVLRLLYGEMAEVVTSGQRVRPSGLLGLGYRFSHPELNGALDEALHG